MATLRFELEIDAEVYPELHAALSGIRNPASRVERLRQLAATGLVWETVRVHGASVARLPGTAAARPRAEPAAEPAAEDWIRAASAARPAVPRAAGSVPGSAAAVQPPAPLQAAAWAAVPPRPAAAPIKPADDFIDLALDAQPPRPGEAAPTPPPERRTRERGIPPLEIPLLLDMVTPPPAQGATLQPSTLLADTPRAAAVRLHELSLPRPEDLPPEVELPRPLEPAAVDLEAREVATAEAGPAPAEHTSGVRSRLLRMKEMGLFKNG